MKNKKLLAIFVTLMCIWIAFCTKWGIDMCEENEQRAAIPDTIILPEYPNGSAYFKLPDGTILYSEGSTKDSTVVFDSLGIKIVGYNTK